MLKIRATREVVDETVTPIIHTEEYLWIGCIPSELARIYPVGNDTTSDQLKYCEAHDGQVRISCRFEAFADGLWFRISDPRINPVPATEEDLLNQLNARGCPDCMTINLDMTQADATCHSCDEYFYCVCCKKRSKYEELNQAFLCDMCEGLIECDDCGCRYDRVAMVGGKCIGCDELASYEAEAETEAEAEARDYIPYEQ
jgi:hypothetical protein